MGIEKPEALPVEEPLDDKSERVLKGLTKEGLVYTIRKLYRENEALRKGSPEAPPPTINGNTLPQVERLVCLFEETAELQHVVAKALRFGLDDLNPEGGEGGVENRVLIARESGDLMAILKLLTDAGDLRLDLIADARKLKRERLKEWTRHQSIE